MMLNGSFLPNSDIDEENSPDGSRAINKEQILNSSDILEVEKPKS